MAPAPGENRPKTVQVYAPGAILRMNDVKCVVLLVQLDHDGADQYFVAWWEDRERVTEWVMPHELEPLAPGDVATLSVLYG